MGAKPGNLQVKRKKNTFPTKKAAGKDDFTAVAKRLGCDEDKAAFEKRLGKIAKAKPGESK